MGTVFINRKKLTKLCLVVFFCISSIHLNAAVVTYNQVSGDWNTAENWNNGGNLPGATSQDFVVINHGKVVTVASDVPVSAFPIDLRVSNDTYGKLILQADLTCRTFRITTAGSPTGIVEHVAGDLTVNDIFKASDDSGSTVSSYTIYGGSLSVANAADMGSNGEALFSVIGTAPQSITAGSMDLDFGATLHFELDSLGVTPIDCAGLLSIDALSELIIDGTNYEGLDGYFPLFKAAARSGTFDPALVSFVGLEGRNPSLVYDGGEVWLRLTERPSLSERLCSLFVDSSVATDYNETTFSINRELQPTISAWSPPDHEAQVMDTFISHTVTNGVGASNRTWEVRMGRGGQIYSFRTPSSGETVPPSYSGSGHSPWVDEVWQGVAVDTFQNDPPDNKYFIHQAGVYYKDPALKEPFYSPQVAAHIDEENRSFTTINWGQHAHLENFIDADPLNDFQSHLLYFTRFRDLGQGVIEMSLGFYNYGGDHLRHFNLPWGGVRRTALEYPFLSNPGGTSWVRKNDRYGSTSLTGASNTGGWLAFSDDINGNGPALAVVSGFDETPLIPGQWTGSVIRWGYAGGAIQPGEADWRNYLVYANVRRYELTQGKGIWARYYFVLGDDVTDVATHIADRQLVDNTMWTPFTYAETNTPLIAYSYSESVAGVQIVEDGSAPDFLLYAHPIEGSFPIYEILEDDETRHLTWNPYATGVIKTYDGTIAGMRLLGFALRSADVAGSSYSYEPIETALSGVVSNYLASGESLVVRSASPIETWRAKYWGFPEDAGDGANDMDPDGDLSNNLYEFALGGNPMDENDVGYSPMLSQQPGGFMTYSYPRRIGSQSYLNYRLEWSNNLLGSAWSDTGYVELAAPQQIDPKFESVSNLIIEELESDKFIRLKVEVQ